MINLSMGYLKPQNPDTGDSFFPALETDIQMLNDHDHDGVTSQLLSSTSQTVQSANWIAAPIGGGLYYQTVTVPTGYSLDQCEVWHRFSTGEKFFGGISRVSATQYNIFCNDNTKTITAFYR